MINSTWLKCKKIIYYCSITAMQQHEKEALHKKLQLTEKVANCLFKCKCRNDNDDNNSQQ